MYVKLNENNIPIEWPLSFSRIRKDHPNVSFPADTTKVDVSAYGYAPFKFFDFPEHDAEYQKVEELTPVLSNGVYNQTWQVVDRYTAEERAAYDAQKEEELPLLKRAQRNMLLMETDWWASSDLTMSAEQTAYRQALRDITSHANWPHLEESDWPTKPE